MPQLSHLHYFYRTLAVKNLTKPVDTAKRLSITSEDRRFLQKLKNAQQNIPGPCG